MFSNSMLDWGLVAAYFAFLGVVWWRGRGRRAGTLDYMVAGRAVTLPAFVATLVATWYGGILGVGEYSWRYGVANWIVFGVPYYVGALLFALLFARRARVASLYTLPDLLDRRYGRGAALFGAFTVFVSSAPAAYVLVLGTLFSAMTGWALAPCIVMAAGLSMFYIDKGGLRTVVFTDQVQFALMFLGFAMMLAFLVARHGLLPFTPGALPASHFTWNGGNPPQAIFVWYFIALSTLVDPGFWQRAYAARDPRVARDGVLWSIAWWALFDFMTTTCGLYARALLPHLEDPVYAFPELARVALPHVALGIFYLGMIATVMSTIDSYGFIAATTIGRDFIWRLRRDPDDSRVPFYSRLGLAISTVFATGLALMNHSVIDLWHDIGSVVTPTLLVPVASALLGVGSRGGAWALATMLVPFATALAWVVAKHLHPQQAYPLGMEPIYPGLAASVAMFAAGWAVNKRRRGGGAESGAPLALAAVAFALAATPLSGALAIARAADSASPSMASRAAADSTSPAVAGGGAAASDTLSHVVTLPEVVVNTARADAQAPIARTTLDRAALKSANWGQDTPMALAMLPGAYAYSDAGNGIGYSYLSIRGFPQRRISVLINGVPLNDPESHEVYWIDHPDLLASTAEVQLQRGVGSSLYGAASVGGSVNLDTAPMSDTPAMTASVSGGSYDTRRLMLEMNSGPLAHGWSTYARYSRIETNGYRDQSDTRLWSYAVSVRRLQGRQSLRMNLYGGPEETHLAYLGIPREDLDGGLTGNASDDRRFNPLGYAGERDHFFEPHYELIHSWSPRDRVAFTQTLFWFDGRGYYDEQRFGQDLAGYRLAPWFTADTTAHPGDYFARDSTGAYVTDAQGRRLLERTDIVRRRTVQNQHYGWVPRVRLEHAGGALTLGGELRAHDGRHFGQVVSGNGLPPGTEADLTYYDFHPRTLAAGAYVREEWNARSDVRVTGDLAWRHQRYSMRDDRFDGVRFDQTYDFALPRLGVTWSPTPRVSAFAAWSSAAREPALRDLYDGEGVGNVPLYAQHDPLRQSYRVPLVHPEHVQDWELGGAWQTAGAALTVNLFRMVFRDELVYAGQFDTDLGYPILGNAARSVHQGVELAARGQHALAGGISLAVNANATLSDNHFVEYRERYGTTAADEVRYDGNTIGFFPAALGNLSIALTSHGVRLGADGRCIGRMFLDNTATDAASIAPHSVLDLNGGYGMRVNGARVEFTLRMFNAFDRRYETGGYMDYDAAGNLAPQFIPAATRNALAEVRVEF